MFSPFFRDKNVTKWKRDRTSFSPLMRSEVADRQGRRKLRVEVEEEGVARSGACQGLVSEVGGATEHARHHNLSASADGDRCSRVAAEAAIALRPERGTAR